MKKLVIGSLALVIGVWLLFFDWPFYFLSRSQSEEIAGFTYPRGSELVFRRKSGPYKIFKWRIPKEEFLSIVSPEGVSHSPFHPFVWQERNYTEFSDGPDKMLKPAEMAAGSESIRYRTPVHAVELVRSQSDSSITIISIYNGR